jgi:hypothetical protein
MHLSDLDHEEAAALRAYKSAHDANGHGSFCFDVNELLQSGLWTDELGDEFRRHVAALDRVLQRSPPIQNDLTAYRGIGSVSVLGLLKLERKFRSLSFWSASSSRSVAASFVKPQLSSSVGAILTLRLPVGTQLYDMETLTGAGGSEREILLPRGLLWRIEEIEKGNVSEALPPARKHLVSLAHITLQLLDPRGRPLT